MQPLLVDILISALALLLFLADLALPAANKRPLGFLACAGLTLILALTFTLDVHGTAFHGAFTSDALALWFKRLFLGAGALACLAAVDQVARDFTRRQGEYYLLLVLSLLGMSLLASARELIFFLISFELMSIPLFVLTAFAKEQRRSTEAALKFYLVGVTSFVITLYGLSLVYGATGTTFLPEIALRATDPSPLLLAGILTTLAGLAFKIGAVPFHMWIPDTYEGASTPFIAFLSVAPKAAGFAALIRLYLEGFAPLATRYQPTFVVLCAITMIFGNLLALPQSNIKRLLAYSGIAQIGVMLLGFLTPSTEGLALLLFYLSAYLFTNLGAFAVVTAVHTSSNSDDLSAYRGLARRNPALALSMLLFLLSLGGIPFVAGFWAKLGIFVAAWPDHTTLVILGAVLAVVGIFYYLRVARSIYLDDPQEPTPIRVPPALTATILICAVAVVLIGIFPRILIDSALSVAAAWHH
jgi:NADH-quinone oxidoreductase subunit N